MASAMMHISRNSCVYVHSCHRYYGIGTTHACICFVSDHVIADFRKLSTQALGKRLFLLVVTSPGERTLEILQYQVLDNLTFLIRFDMFLVYPLFLWNKWSSY